MLPTVPRNLALITESLIDFIAKGQLVIRRIGRKEDYEVNYSEK